MIKGLKKFRNTLPQNNHNDFIICSKTFCGEGFYLNKVGIGVEKGCYCYDINWAYAGTLINDDYPLTDNLSFKNPKSKLGIFLVKIDAYRKKYNTFDYTLFNKKIVEATKKHNYSLFTNLDFEIFNDLYEWQGKVIAKAWYADIGPLSDDCKKFVIKQYNLKKQKKLENSEDYEEFKTNLEKIIYGKQAQRKFYKDKNADDTERNQYIAIALFQSSYLRYREWKMFKKYENDILYMNTDSIYAGKKLDIATSEELGQYNVEFENVIIFFIGRMKYIIFNEKMQVIKQCISGTFEELSKRKIKLLMDGWSVLVKSRDREGQDKDITLTPTFLNWLYNEKHLKTVKK